MVDPLALAPTAFTTLAVSLAAFTAVAVLARREPGASRSGPHLRWRHLARTLGRLAPPRVHLRLARAISRAGGLGGLTASDVVARSAFAAALASGLGVGVALAADLSIAWAPLAATLAALLPLSWLRDQVARRQHELRRDLPYDLDLLTLSVEAGLDFTAAVQKVVDRGKPGPLRDELQTFLAALRMGHTRADALTAMATRVSLPELSSVVSSLLLADRLGTGLARTLRIQADQLRLARFQRAEARAGEAPVRMLIPLVLFVFPTLWLVLGAPLVFEYFFAGR